MKIICVCRRLAEAGAICGAMLCPSAALGDSLQWEGKGKYRILVSVEPRDLGVRDADEIPTRIHINTKDVHDQTGMTRKIDVASIQVAQYDPATGQPLKNGNWHYARTDWELPYRWYDDSIPEAFPEVVGNLDTATGELKYSAQHGWGYFYETLGEWDAGNLAWIHTQRGNDISHYAIYFDLLPDGATPDEVPRTGFIGDGGERSEEQVGTTHGLLMSRVEPADWDGDGLIDLLVGCERGGMVWYPNRGTKEQPQFPYPKLMFTSDGKPLDVGFNSVPVVVDWDKDGIRDLVSAAYPDRVVWYRNLGSNAAPKLEYRGLVLVDGKPFSLPHEPVPESEGIYTVDYFPTLAAADWDGDGDDDLLAGGYVTGMIFFFENSGHGSDGTPALKSRGPIEADGRPIDTQWSAAPGVLDLDNDGDLDLVSGSMAMTETGGDSSSSRDFLYYFENVGTRSQPCLSRKPFPVKGELPVSSLAGPRPIDMNNDGLPDLVVARTTDLSIYYNVGTKDSPLWEFGPPLPGKWRSVPLYGWATQLLDWNEDNRFDVVQGFSVRLNSGKGNPQFFDAAQSVTGPGETIFHKSPSGDQWTFTHVVDLDADGKRDILYGVHEGWVYFHRKLTSGDDVNFDTAGVRLNTEDGNPIKVGPVADQKRDFDTMQGARTTIAAADFDRDGNVDLIVGDTYGVLRYYRNLTGDTNPTFASPEVIATMNMRLVPTIADWNEDGWTDILIGSSQSYVLLNSGKPTSRFLPAELLKVPPQSTPCTSILEQIPGSPEWRLVEPPDGAGLYLPFETVVNAADWNDDGDEDLLALASYGYLCWYERSFLEHGYARATVEKIDTRLGAVEKEPQQVEIAPGIEVIRSSVADQAGVPSRFPFSHGFASGSPVAFATGKVQLVYRPVADNQLEIASSDDAGKTWVRSGVVTRNADPEVTINRPSMVRLRDGTIWVFYSGHVRYDALHPENSRSDLWAIRSTDGGKTWRDHCRIWEGYAGMPGGAIETRSGSIILPFEYPDGPGRWVCACLVSSNGGETWNAIRGIDIGKDADDDHRSVALSGGGMEPTIVQLKDGRIWMLVRTITGKLWQSYSADDGPTWSAPVPTSISCGGTLYLTRLASGRLALVWNQANWSAEPQYGYPHGFDEASIALSDDDGVTWREPIVFAKAQRVCHSLLTETAPGQLLITMPSRLLLLHTTETVLLKE